MYCVNCGNEINDNALFCPHCGTRQQPVLQNTSQAQVKKKKNGGVKRVILILVIAVIAIVIGFNAARKAELAAVETIAGQYMDMIKNGPDEEMMDELVNQFIFESISNDTIANYLANNIKGEDALDIYKAIMRHMSYKITNVQKVEANHYRITIEVSNMNNRIMATETAKAFVSRYIGNGKVGAIMQAIEDLSSDKSKVIASLYEEVSDYYYSLNDAQYFATGEYVIDVEKINGEWTPSCAEGLENFLMSAAGLLP